MNAQLYTLRDCQLAAKRNFCGLQPSEPYGPELAEGHARVTPHPSTRSRADRGDSGDGWAPSSVRMSRRLNRVELSLNDPRRERLLHQKPWPRADLCFQWIAPRFLESQRNQLLYCRLIDRKAAYPTAVLADLEGGDN